MRKNTHLSDEPFSFCACRFRRLWFAKTIFILIFFLIPLLVSKNFLNLQRAFQSTRLFDCSFLFRITTSQKKTSYQHQTYVRFALKRRLLHNTFGACGEPGRDMAKVCAFSFPRCWRSFVKQRKAILQNNI